jgi:ABC-type multidrug transport system ATPase subunit
VLAIESVTKRYRDGTVAVRELSLAAEAGVLGLLGPNGAGKTTLLQMVATVTRPTAGRITFDGRDVLREPDAVRRRLGYLPQDFGVYDTLTAEETLTYFAALKGVRSRTRVHEMLERVNLHAVARRRVGGFSGGMRQRLGIAQALINDPDLLIVDEPTAGLDPEERLRFRHLLGDLGRGKLVVLSTHIVSDIESLATRVSILRGGRLIAHDAPEALLRAARGSVWEATLTTEEYEARRAAGRISRVAHVAGGVRVRVVAPAPPTADARPVEPSLEDAFLHFMAAEPAPPAGARP